MMVMPTHGWRPPRGGGRAQRDTALKLIASHFAKIQNWGSCLRLVAKCREEEDNDDDDDDDNDDNYDDIATTFLQSIPLSPTVTDSNRKSPTVAKFVKKGNKLNL